MLLLTVGLSLTPIAHVLEDPFGAEVSAVAPFRPVSIDRQYLAKRCWI